MINNKIDRFFQDLDETITGRSVVVENMGNNQYPVNSLNVWPYDLSDYLRSLVGKHILVKYLIGGKNCEKNGELLVVGSDFIGIQLNATKDLFIIKLSMVQCVNVMNYKNAAEPYRKL